MRNEDSLSNEETQEAFKEYCSLCLLVKKNADGNTVEKLNVD